MTVWYVTGVCCCPKMVSSGSGSAGGVTGGFVGGVTVGFAGGFVGSVAAPVTTLLG